MTETMMEESESKMLSRSFFRASTCFLALAVSAPTMLAVTSSATAADVKSILFVNPLPNYPAWREIGDCTAKRAKALGIAETESGPTGGTLDTTVMIQQIQQGMANHDGAILTFPATDGFTPVLQQARKDGIIVGTYWGGGQADKAANVNVGANFNQVGEIFAEAIGRRPGEQHVGLMAQNPTGAAKAFVDGFEAAAKKYPNISISAVVYTNDDASKALDAANALLTAHPDINVIASHMGTATQGAIAAIKAKGLLGKVVYLGNGLAGGGEQGLKDGAVYRVFVQDLCGAGTAMVDAVTKIASGEKVSAQIDVGVRMVNKDDYQTYVKQGWQ